MLIGKYVQRLWDILERCETKLTNLYGSLQFVPHILWQLI